MDRAASADLLDREGASRRSDQQIDFRDFAVEPSPAREGRNPWTGAPIKIAASKKLGFTPANAIKDKLNG
nr:HU family DNA-binding protein [Stakelama pacifica]